MVGIVDTYVYCMKSGEHLKFGITSSDPDARCRSLQTGNPEKIEVFNYALYESENDARTLEKLIHAYLYHYRERGEWFKTGSRPLMVASMLADDDLLDIILLEVKKQIDYKKDVERLGKREIVERWSKYWDCKFKKSKVDVGLSWKNAEHSNILFDAECKLR